MSKISQHQHSLESNYSGISIKVSIFKTSSEKDYPSTYSKLLLKLFKER